MSHFTIQSFKAFKDNINPVHHNDLPLLFRQIESLGINLPKTIGWTISPPSKSKIIISQKKFFYYELTPTQQYNWLINEYVPRVVSPYVSNGVIVPELNKQGNIHIHLLCYDSDIHDLWTLKELQNTVFQCTYVKALLGKQYNTQNSMHLNYIHFIEDYTKWKEYLNKDREKLKKHTKPYYFGFEEYDFSQQETHEEKKE